MQTKFSYLWYWPGPQRCGHRLDMYRQPVRAHLCCVLHRFLSNYVAGHIISRRPGLDVAPMLNLIHGAMQRGDDKSYC